MDLNGAEILAVGTWNGTTFTDEDLQNIVFAFFATQAQGRIPLKIGHDADHLSDDAPALGWVKRLWVDGTKLMADFTDVPEKLLAVIKKGMYKFISVELLRDVKASTRVLPWVLDAVAILGATPPAVGILKDLQSLVLARRPAMRFRARVAMARAPFIFSEDKGMDKAEVEKLLKDTEDRIATTFSAQVTTLTKSVQDANAALATEKENVAKIKLSSHRQVIKAKFEAAVAALTLEPKHREMFYKTTGVDDDARVLAIDLTVVDEYIKEHAKAAPAAKTGAKFSVEGFEETEDTEVTQAMSTRVTQLALSRKLNAKDPMIRADIATEILKTDKKFAASYNNGPGTTLKEAM